MIICTPPFKPSRMIKTFKKSFNEQLSSHSDKTGRLNVLPGEMLKMAGRAAGVTISTELSLLTMI